MKLLTAVLTVTALSCVGTYAADRAALPAAGPVHIVTTEPGVVPPGASLVVRAADSINTRKAYHGTVYEANVAEDMVDQNGAVLIPRQSPVELVVRSFPYLGPGGVGMTSLTLSVKAITVKGMRYPVATVGDTLDAGGIRAHEDAIRTIGADESAVETSGHRIRVPSNTLLAFRTEDPIRLNGYRR
jgi:hypothetical protein